MSRPEHSVNDAAWAAFVDRYGVGDTLDGDVVHVVPFGAFIRLGDGVDGFAPQSLWPAPPALGSRTAVRVEAIDPEHRRVALRPA